MSGGYFDYAQFRINDIVEQLKHVIETNNSRECPFSLEVINRFREGMDALNRADIYAQRIDWLLSGDDGEESFLHHLSEELNSLGLDQKK